MDELGPALVLKLSSPTLMHKSELRALALDLRSPEDVRAAYRRLLALGDRQRRGARGANGGARPGAARVRPPRRRGARAGGGPGRGVDRDPRRRGGGPAARHAGAGGARTALAARREHPHGRPRRHAARPGRRRPPGRRRGRPAARGGARPDRAQPGAGARARRAGRGRAGRASHAVRTPSDHRWLTTTGTAPDAGAVRSARGAIAGPWCSSAPIPEPRRPGHAARRLRALVRARGTVLGRPPPPVRGGPALRRAADGDEPPVPGADRSGPVLDQPAERLLGGAGGRRRVRRHDRAGVAHQLDDGRLHAAQSLRAQARRAPRAPVREPARAHLLSHLLRVDPGGVHLHHACRWCSG